MSIETKTIVLCEAETGGARTLFNFLRKDLNNEVEFFHHKFLSLLQEEGGLQPDIIVCDFATSPFQEALANIKKLREVFPTSGIIVYYNNTDLGPETIGLRFVICHDQLLLKMARDENVTRELANHAIGWGQRT